MLTSIPLSYLIQIIVAIIPTVSLTRLAHLWFFTAVQRKSRVRARPSVIVFDERSLLKGKVANTALYSSYSALPAHWRLTCEALSPPELFHREQDKEFQTKKGQVDSCSKKQLFKAVVTVF